MSQAGGAAASGKPAASWWHHVSVLADDSMEGRETGTPGYERAASYVAKQLEAMGLSQPSAKGYYQQIQFRSVQIDEPHSSLELLGNGGRQRPKLSEDAILDASAPLGRVVEADLVFAGYGLTIPESGYDDLKGLDVRGKVVVLVNGSPAGVSPALASFYRFPGERWKLLRALGAVGTISILNPAGMDLPWPRIATNYKRPKLAIDEEALLDTPGRRLAVVWNPASADQLLEGSGHSWEELASLAKEGKPLPRFALSQRIRANIRLRHAKSRSANVVAMLPGSDPRLRNEYVVVSAHLDHLGAGKANQGDSIYNGAMDNAAGVATVLEAASALKSSRVPMRRSILFVLFTGEEEGELGSKYFAAHPPVPIDAIVADINIDMYKPIIPFHLLTVFGFPESDIGDYAREAAEQTGVVAQNDPEPQRNRFIRSDQFSFIRRGIPGVNMHIGAPKGSKEEEVLRQWQRERYHDVSDDLSQPVDLESAAKYNRIVQLMAMALANAENRPEWKPGSFFNKFSKGESAHPQGKEDRQ